VYFGIRPEDMAFTKDEAGENGVPLRITVVEPLGAETHLWLTTGSQTLVVRTEPRREFKVGETVRFVPRMDKARYFDKTTELSLLAELDEKAR